MKEIKRREFFKLAAVATSGLAVAGCGGSIASEGIPGQIAFNEALARFRNELPGTASFAVEVESAENEQLLRVDHLSDQQLLIGSAFKTFIITKCLQDIEAGNLSYDKQIAIDDSVRVNNAPVFDNLAGTVQLRSVLDAIAAYSDNIAADAAIAQVGPNRVRAFLASAGLTSTRIPDSIRVLESYLGGAPLGVDIGWAGIQLLLRGILPGTPRPAINDEVSIISTMSELVSYYKRALKGDFFSKPSTVTGFKRIHSEGNLTFGSVPDTPIFAKVGNASWLEFHTLCYPGQMILCNGIKVTFAFTINWTAPDSETPAISQNFIGIIGDALNGLKNSLGTVKV